MSDNQFDQWEGKSGNVVIEDPHKRMLDKLSKLLEVRDRAATEAEAATAASILSRFLTEHNLSIADIERKGQAAPSIAEGNHDLGKAAFKWKLDLAEGIAQFYYCAPLVNRSTKKVSFAGRPDNVEALTMLYQWVIDQIKKIATEERRKHFDTTGEHIDPLRWQLSFGEGAVERLVDRLAEMKARQQEDASRDEMGQITALAVHHQSEVSDYLEKEYGYRVDGKETAREREYRLKSEARQSMKVKLKAECEANGNMEPYYTEFPWERPETPEQQAAREKRWAEAQKREARNARRRRGSYRSGPATDWDKLEQQETARSSGRAASGRVNLQPFIEGGKTKGAVE